MVLYAIMCYILPRYIDSILYYARDTVVGVESTIVFGWSVLGARTSAYEVKSMCHMTHGFFHKEYGNSTGATEM